MDTSLSVARALPHTEAVKVYSSLHSSFKIIFRRGSDSDFSPCHSLTGSVLQYIPIKCKIWDFLPNLISIWPCYLVNPNIMLSSCVRVWETWCREGGESPSRTVSCTASPSPPPGSWPSSPSGKAPFHSPQLLHGLVHWIGSHPPIQPLVDHLILRLPLDPAIYGQFY